MEQHEREGLIWLLGLLSTDGSVTKEYTTSFGEIKHHPWFRISTTELDWANRMKEIFSSIGIECKIYKWKRKDKNKECYTVLLRNQRDVYERLNELNMWLYLSPRKRKLIEKITPLIAPYWTSEEDELIIPLRESDLTWKQISNVLKENGYNRTWSACRMRHARLIDKEWAHKH